MSGIGIYRFLDACKKSRLQTSHNMALKHTVMCCVHIAFVFLNLMHTQGKFCTLLHIFLLP
ncbi:hypothetical protein HOLleu_40380 [Holothuria leucospilota]|uniref:Uncharacterized protein n=1 Tax=Holothuria leucospilota TaxID=206669 RepID=A0A9Q1BDK3_HOLLE|nr:hypothetical protein HOLleu_40380 [Holothuria leucospilota]